MTDQDAMQAPSLEPRPYLSLWTLAVTIAGLLWIDLASAAPYQSLASIREAARQFVLEQDIDQATQPRIEVGQLDSRLRLTKCTEPLQAFTPPGSRGAGKTTVGVRCTGNKRWTLYVPVTISVMGQVVVAVRDLYRGNFIGDSDITLEQRDLGRLHHGYLHRTQLALGKRIKRTIRRGRVVRPTQISAPILIRKGDEVTIEANLGRINIRTKGKALAKGGAGERIQVRNLSSKKLLDATVVNAGTVRVEL